MPLPQKEERKLVTVLFADLTGSTALGERLDPERLRALLAQYFGAMATVIEGWHGKVEKFIGDAIMSVFGIPSTHEDDAERALNAALDMQSRLAELNDELHDLHGVRLAIRIGVNTGEVLAGSEGTQPMVSGDAVNVAARLQQVAEPAQVVVGERTHLAARGAFAFEVLPSRALAGKASPVRCWRLLGRSELVRRRGISGIAARTIGRERELGIVTSLYRTTIDEGRPGLVTIMGDAGVGKTRLVEEFLTRARSVAPSAVFIGRCLSYGEGTTYWALREILWEAAGIRLDDPASIAAEKLERLCAELFADSSDGASDADRVVFALATTAGIAVVDNPLAMTSPESIGEELGLAWPRLVSALAARQPTVIVIEDLHRAEAPLLDMLDHLVTRSSGSVLLVATARPELSTMRPAWSSRPGVSQIRLDPLTTFETDELLAELLPAVRPETRQKVATAAEGNPFFAEEIVGHLLDKGVLVSHEQGVVEEREITSVTIPDSVHVLLAARVDALPVMEKRTLQDAAVVGRIFWRTALDFMAGDNPSTRASLAALESRDLIVARPNSSLPGQAEFAFRHALTREVAYRSIPKARRAQAHAGVANWIEELVGERRLEYIELLAHHYESAGDPEAAALAWPADSAARERFRTRALAALLEAGLAALSRFVIDASLGFAERAIAVAEGDTERLRCLTLKAQAAHAGVRTDEAWAAYLGALGIAERTGDAQGASLLRANATLLWTRYGGAFRDESWKPVAQELMKGLEELGEGVRTFEGAALLIGRSMSSEFGLPVDTSSSLEDAERAVEIAKAVGSQHLLSHALDAVAWTTQTQGFCGSETTARRMLDAASMIADRVQSQELLVTAAMAFAAAGRFEEGGRVGEEAAREARRLAPHHRLHGAAAQSACLLPTGHLDRLLEATADVGELVHEEGDQTCNFGRQALLARVVSLFEANEQSAAAAVLAQFDGARESWRESPPWSDPSAPEVLRPFVGLEAARERAERAVASDMIADGVRRVRAQLQLRALAGEWEEVERLDIEARRLAPQACAPYLAWIADWAGAVRLATAGRSVESIERARAATGALAEYGERYRAARLLVDLLPLLDPAFRGPLAEEVAARLEPIGALASAFEARTYAG